MLVLSPSAQIVLRLAHEIAKIPIDQEFHRSLKKWKSKAPPQLIDAFGVEFATLQSAGTADLSSFVGNSKAFSAPLVDFLGEKLLEGDSSLESKHRGAVFTPFWLANRVARNSQLIWQRLNRAGRRPKVIGDISCGVGTFLAASQVFGPEVRYVGIEKDPNTFNLVSLFRWAIGAEWELENRDSLIPAPHRQDLFEDSTSLSESFDVLIGNPPYVRSASLPTSYVDKIRNQYETTRTGNFDLSVAFVEHAIHALKQDGVAAYILTNKFMTASYGRSICRELSKTVRLLSIEDFQDHQVFPGYTTYTCVLTFAKKPPAKHFNVTRFPRGIEKGRDPGVGETSSLPTERLHKHPWDFAAGISHDALRLLRDPRNPLLSDIFHDVQQGIRTGANEVFVVPIDGANKLDRALCSPFVSAEEIQLCQLDSHKSVLLFPYRRTDWGSYEPLSANEIERQHPRTWKYLQAHRGALTDRSLDNSTPWYCYSRNQNLGLAFKPKILVREMLPKAMFAADLIGRVAFSSGYALDASGLSEDDIQLWTAVLCTPTMEFVLRHHGTQLHSGWFRLMKHHLESVRLPNLGVRKPHAIKLARNLFAAPNNSNALKKLDGIVSECFKLTNEHRLLIASLLEEWHKRSIPSNARRLPENKEKGAARVASKFEPVVLSQYNKLHRDRQDLRHLVTFKPNKSLPIHRWYSYTQGYSATLVDSLLTDLKIKADQIVLDPFLGCGTTTLVSRQRGIRSIGIEVSPLMAFVANAKTTPWNVNEIRQLTSRITARSFSTPGNLPAVFERYLSKAYSANTLNQLSAIAAFVDSGDFSKQQKTFLRMGLVSILEEVSQIRKHGSHYRYLLDSENIGLSKLNIKVFDPKGAIAPVYIKRLNEMLADVESAPQLDPKIACKIQVGDARKLALEARTISAVITSPPYLNRNNYIAQQKAELAILKLVENEREYRSLVKRTFRSHTDSDLDDRADSSFADVREILSSLKLKDSNNQFIPHMIAGYFEDLNLTLRELYRVLKRGGVTCFVVGNTRWGGVVVPVDHLLLMIAEKIGFKAERIWVTRLKGNSPQQMREFGRIPVRESVVVMKKV